MKMVNVVKMPMKSINIVRKLDGILVYHSAYGLSIFKISDLIKINLLEKIDPNE